MLIIVVDNMRNSGATASGNGGLRPVWAGVKAH
jgi:hypothetical protein